MTDPSERRRRTDPPQILTYFGYVMVLVYFVLGAIILFTDQILPGMPESQRNILGGLLLIYGLYRGYTVYIKSKKRYDDR
ncbi:MAG: hypothetical protein EOP51_29380 [Sphingobacteriales bacterium]|nr:MAG: hypothetical protein EOP51_29380 [Sphingobacteriales bacterium]